ncbi:peptidase M48 [Litorimonas cladophorae]|uniref:Peptidase M48 n=1 Tax=Litorimonas cladophorae TaxID=1220491 RepID=A0A918KCA0_9PROT|nr:M48 family metallopeptidase [Litorimonas cladophorae]GGX58361.1 peptidase M48 [Litorimonas cladophorae]
MCNHEHAHGETEAPHVALMPRRRLLKALTIGGTAAAVSACTTNPYTGRKQLVGLAPGDLSGAAEASWAEMKAKIPTSNDPRYTSRLRNIGSRISRSSPFANEAWDYQVFDTDTKNAFVLPGNRVGFYKGMMDFAESDDAIAGIMGHEVGHVAGAHARERMSMQMASQLAVVGGTVIGGVALNKKCDNVPANQRTACQRSASQNTARLQQALGLGTLLGLVLPYSRKHEAESDLLGANYMQRAGYNPYESVKLWEKMAANSTSSQPTFLSTHPDPAWRARNLDAYIRRQEKLGSQGFQNIRT